LQKQMIHNLFKKIKNHSFCVKYWDGEVKIYGDSNPNIKIIFNQSLPISFDFTDPMLALGEAYMEDIVDWEGNFDEVMELGNNNKGLLGEKGEKILKTTTGILSKMNIKAKQKENIHQHYDLGNDFFSLWLDDTMSYSCAYFNNSTDSLEQAQLNKIDHILKKLQLKPGEKLLDIGSGWGWLIIRAAQEYGVRATGITISEEQYKESLVRIKNLGLTEKVDVQFLDYLDLDANDNQFDKIVSVGMIEHVGKGNLYKYMDKIEKLLVPGGLSMVHAIMGTTEDGVNSWIEKYIFPGGYIPSLRETISLFPEYDFHLLHAESLRMHYAMTLERWHSNYMKHWDEVEAKYGRRFARMWELYLVSCAASFRVSGLNIYQLLFSKGLNNGLPLTLNHVYQ